MFITKREPIHTRRGGEAVTLVPLANCSEQAIIATADYEWLIEAGVSPNWIFNWARPGHCYVRCAWNRVGSLETMARILTGAIHIRRSRVKYRTNDRLDLRRDNLILMPPTTLNEERRTETADVVRAFARREQAAFDVIAAATAWGGTRSSFGHPRLRNEWGRKRDRCHGFREPPYQPRIAIGAVPVPVLAADARIGMPSECVAEFLGNTRGAAFVFKPVTPSVARVFCLIRNPHLLVDLAGDVLIRVGREQPFTRFLGRGEGGKTLRDQGRVERHATD